MRKFTVLANLILVVPAALCSASMALAQSQTDPKSQAQSQPTPQATVHSTGQSAAQPPAQSEPQLQVLSQPQEDSLAEAARKARAKKAKTEPAKVYTDENISGLRGGGVSVVGEGTSGGAPTTENADFGAEPKAPAGAKSGGSEEEYWRGKARQLLDQIAVTDSEIKKVQEEIEKYGNVGFDPSTGVQRNTIYVDDRNAHLKQLENRKSELEKQMDALQEEGRKAGAEPSWFR